MGSGGKLGTEELKEYHGVSGESEIENDMK